MTARRLAPWLVALSILASNLLFTTTAFAHAAYKDSSPQDEATVASPPSSVWAEYTEPLQDGSNMEIYDPCGQRVDHDDTQITGYRMTVSMTGERSGTYSVSWVAASAVDPHVTRGTFTFTVTDGPACETAPAPSEEESEQEETREESASSSEGRTQGSATSTRGRRARAAADDTTRVRGTRIGARDNRPRRDRIELAQQRTPVETESETGIWDGIPWDWFGIAMLLSAVIGAAGGRIYAGIMGPRR